MPQNELTIPLYNAILMEPYALLLYLPRIMFGKPYVQILTTSIIVSAIFYVFQNICEKHDSKFIPFGLSPQESFGQAPLLSNFICL